MDMTNKIISYSISFVLVILSVIIFFNRKNPEQIAFVKERNRITEFLMERYYWPFLKFSTIITVVLVGLLYIYYFFIL